MTCCLIFSAGAGSAPASPTRPGEAPAARGDDTLVASKALPKFLSAIAPASRTSPVLIDFGPVIGTNVEFFGERLGCKLFIEDLFAEFDRHTRAGTLDDLAATFESASATATPASTASCAGMCSISCQDCGAGACPSDRPDAASRRVDGDEEFSHRRFCTS